MEVISAGQENIVWHCLGCRLCCGAAATAHLNIFIVAVEVVHLDLQWLGAFRADGHFGEVR